MDKLVDMLEQRVTDTQRELDGLLGQRTGLDGRIQALQEALEHYRAILDLERGTSKPSASEFKGKSIKNAALTILGRAGRPLHVTEIWKRMSAGGLTLQTETPEASVNSSLTKNRHLFQNIGGRTWRLVGEGTQAELLTFGERTERT